MTSSPVATRRVVEGWRAAIAGAAMTLGALASAQAGGLAFGPAPAWVEKAEVPASSTASRNASGAVDYLLLDAQTRWQPGDRSRYRHVAMRPLTGDGVEDVAHVEIPFDPTYETLTLHGIVVHRGGRVLSRLSPANVHLLQREADLDARIYDGRQTASALLEDIRVGDIVEYDYTVRGANPALRERDVGGFQLQWDDPIQRVRTRLLVPEGREPRITPRHATLQPEVRHHDGWTDYAWREDAVPALEQDDDTPAWHDATPTVAWTDFPDWSAVAAWALPLYRVDADQGPALRAEVEAIARASADPQARVLATLRFVQREVRYLGIEVGVGSYVPRTPRQVLQHRFGDCKDKALLTAWMLQAMGIDARPALVSSQSTRGIEDLPPSPGAFDHVVLRVRLGGRTWWLDPTRAEQKGTLQTLSQADFGRALVVDPATTGLEAMVDPRTVVRARDIHTVIDATHGRGQPATMQVTTVYRGESADWMRGRLASTSRDELQRGNLRFYADDYPGIATERPFTVSDDEARNELTVVESYRLNDIWQRTEAKKRWTASIPSPEISSALRLPHGDHRTSPFSLGDPSTIDAVTEIRLHEDWPLDVAPVSVDDPAFGYRCVTSWAGRVVRMTEHFETRADHVPAADIARFAANVRQVRDTLGLQLYQADQAPRHLAGSTNWTVLMAGLAFLAAALALAWRLERLDPPPAPTAEAGGPAGIRGWLLLPALHVVLYPLLLVRNCMTMLPGLRADTWELLTRAGGAAYRPWWAPTILAELALNIGMLVGGLLVLWLFFRRRTSVPRLYVGLVWFAVAARGLDLVAGGLLLPGASVSQDWARLGGDAIAGLLWTAYFLRSRRVANTFVARRRPAATIRAGVAGEAPVPDEEGLAQEAGGAA